MDPQDACLKVLADAAPETLHWTVVLDRALTARLIDPFTTPDVRGVVVKTLAALAREGRVVKAGTGLYLQRLPGLGAGPWGGQPAGDGPGARQPGPADQQPRAAPPAGGAALPGP